MSDITLKPCPFCGSKTAPTVMDQNQALWADPNFDGDLRIVVCCAAKKGGCGSSTGFCDDDEKAAKAWNSRTDSGTEESVLPEAFTERIMNRFEEVT